jgi:TonB family protein
MILRLAIGITAICVAPFVAPRANENTVCVPPMPEWKLLHRVEPVYPAAALEGHIQGTVRFTVVIGKDGRIESLHLVSGHPLLVSAARDAVQQWVYRPTERAGRPVRVVTSIDVRFWLDAYGRPPSEKPAGALSDART